MSQDESCCDESLTSDAVLDASVIIYGWFGFMGKRAKVKKCRESAFLLPVQMVI